MKTFISTDEGRKVHFEFSEIKPGRASCNSGSPLTKRLVAMDDEGLTATIAALKSAQVAPSRLCRKCFYIKTRQAYAAEIGA